MAELRNVSPPTLSELERKMEIHPSHCPENPAEQALLKILSRRCDVPYASLNR
jgi:hypothetical protein